MKFGAHQTFHLRDNWLYKGLQCLNDHGDIFSKEEDAVRTLGVGVNMVPAIKFWMQACGVTGHSKGGKLETSEFGLALQKYDPYIERLGSAWLMHFEITRTDELATTWFWFFNKFGASEFTIDSAVQYLSRFVETNGKKIAVKTLMSDLHTLVNTYCASKYEDRQTPEDNIISPLVRLGLIDENVAGYKINQKYAEEIPTEIFGIALLKFAKMYGFGSEFKFQELLQKDASPAKVFCLGNNQLLEALDNLTEEYSKMFGYKKSGGYFTVQILNANQNKLLESYYEGHRG